MPALIGGCVLGLSSGIAILRGAPLPNWLGWVAIVMAVAFLVPPAFIAAFALLIIWSIVVAVLMFQRWGAVDGELAPASPVSP